MADKKITDLPASAGLAASDLIEVVDDPGGTPVSQKATFTQVAAITETISAAVPRPADSATTTAIATAQSTANTAVTNAATAQSTANAAGSAASTAQGDATTALTNAATALSTANAAQTTANLAEAKIKTTQFLSTYPGSVIAAADNGKRTFCQVAGGVDFGLGIQDDCVVGHEQWIMRTHAGTTDPGGSVILVDAGSDTHLIAGTDRIDTAFQWMCLRCYAYDGGTSTRYWTLEAESVPQRPTVRTAHTASTLTLTPDYGGEITPLNAASNAIAVTIPAALFLAASGVAGGSYARAFRCWHRITSVAGGAITFAGSGGISITYHGSSTLAAGDLVEVLVTSATSADIIVRPAGDPIGTAQTTATDALYPLVQTAHTASTKTLAAGDAGDIIPLNAASNAIAVTIPHTLFAAGGTGRAWSCGFTVSSVAGGAITFAGSGGIVIEYHGKKPSATAIVAGDTIFVTVVSATLAIIHISAVIP